MASSPPLTSASLLLLAAAVALHLPAAASQACKSQTFSTAKFANCTDLPTLNASLHWTYDAAARPGPKLSIAYVAPPARPDGWIAWALNPTSSGMLGAQALVAFGDGDGAGAVAVKTYNISSYGPIAESEIAYAVTGRRAERSGGVIRLFATLALPAGSSGAAAVNQVWQVGAAVRGGVPVKHDFLPENLKSMGSLLLTSAEDGSPAPAPESGGGGNTPSIPRGNNLGGSGRNYGGGFFGVYGVLVLLCVFLGF
ncbi:auxin-induced in root cultures protein 12-like [Salvia miltiorrhiza]|uniref:auxin-induced in root cultures protein 12-like n=1 Tax=Salvia miltiorrhiza TaxID=226208 RepID=UPI0025AD4454|nr:auxin-induced in root cultures protein 12-like [Salvia miltiorrhiza]